FGLEHVVDALHDAACVYEIEKRAHQRLERTVQHALERQKARETADGQVAVEHRGAAEPEYARTRTAVEQRRPERDAVVDALQVGAGREPLKQAIDVASRSQ